MDEITFPADLVEPAYQSSTGELAWPPSTVINAIRYLPSQNVAILGGEVWIVKGGGAYALVRLRNGEVTELAWHTSRKAAAETWPEYCQRTSVESVQAILRLQAPQRIVDEAVPHIHYNLIWVAEDEY